MTPASMGICRKVRRDEWTSNNQPYQRRSHSCSVFDSVAYGRNRVHSAAITRRRRIGAYFSALHRGAGADDRVVPRHGGLEAALAKRASIGICSRRLGCRFRSPVLHGALLLSAALPLNRGTSTPAETPLLCYNSL